MKPKIILTASFEHSEENATFITKLDEASARETNGNRSKLIHQILKKWVEDHDPGNSQQKLDRLMRMGKPYVAPRGCGFCHQPATGVLRFKPTDSLVPLCEEHYRLLVRSPNYERTALTIGEVKI